MRRYPERAAPHSVIEINPQALISRGAVPVVHRASGRHRGIAKFWMHAVDDIDKTDGLVFAIAWAPSRILIRMLEPMRTQTPRLVGPLTKEVFIEDPTLFSGEGRVERRQLPLGGEW